MTNKEIASTFQYLGNIMELHGENKFKIRSYSNAYIQLRKLPQPATEMSEVELAKVRGIGKTISSKIRELVETGTIETLEQYKAKTPQGVQEMLNIKGFGPKKIKVIWKDLGAETIGELLYAVNENRLIELKGFGAKTQADLKQKLEYYQKSKNRFHYAALEADAINLINILKEKLPEAKIALTGAMRRRCNVVDKIEILVGHDSGIDSIFEEGFLNLVAAKSPVYQAQNSNDLPVTLYHCPLSAFGSKQFRYSASNDFLQAFIAENKGVDFKELAEEKAVFEKANLPYIAPELREQDWALGLAKNNQLPTLIEESDIKGVIHTHTTYSDGLNTLEEMAAHAKKLGYEYIGISDHSKAAFYANGLQPERVLRQMAAIDELNKKNTDFKIYKSIESDILNDGRLDYDEDLLSQFDFIIASVHSNLRMDEDKATQRLIAAIENPYTRILGHPTGRLLLSRKGYPIDHQKVIDACAANGVAIELNANPYRLDLDWTWIPLAMEKGVLISINPDAHSTAGIEHIRYGVLSARKGGLNSAGCLNSLSTKDFGDWVNKK